MSLLITDIVMPGMGGIQLAAELRTLQPEISIILTSGYSDREGSMLEPLDPRTTFLPKPYTPDSLIKAVSAALDPTLSNQT